MTFRSEACGFGALAAACLIGLLALGGCSSEGSPRFFKTAQDYVAKKTAPAKPVTAPDGPYIVAGYSGTRSPLALIETRGDIQGFEGYGVAMTLRKGQLSRLRGLGLEFEALYLPSDSPLLGDLAAAARAKTPYERVMEYWIDQQITRERFRCVLAEDGAEQGLTRLREDCASIYSAITFANAYWLDANGTLALSRQWFHPKAGQLTVEHSLAH